MYARMKACLFLANNEPMVVEELTLDPPSAPGEVHVKWAATGVCHSDLSVWEGKLPVPPGSILGHEGAGVVVSANETKSGLQPGDHVIGVFQPSCGECFYCRSGQAYICDQALAIGMGRTPFNRSDGSKLFGALGGLATFSEETVVHEGALVKIPDDFPFEEACLIGCGVTTGVGAALNAAKVTPGSSVAVIGCGGVGQAVVQGARIAGAETIIAVDLNEAKRAAATKLGATHTVDPSVDEPVGFVHGLTDGRGADFTFEVVGTPELQRLSYDMARPGGAACWVGVPALSAEVTLPGAMVTLQAKSVIGTMYGNANCKDDFVRFINYAKKGDLNLTDMVSQKLTIDDINEAFTAMVEGDVIR